MSLQLIKKETKLRQVDTNDDNNKSKELWTPKRVQLLRLGYKNRLIGLTTDQNVIKADNTDIKNINWTAAAATNSHITAAQFLHTT